MVEVCHYGETVICELLALVLDKAQGYFTDKRGPAAIGAPWAKDPVTEGESIEVNDVTRRLFAKSVALAALEDVRTEGLVATDEECDALVFV